MGAIPLTMPSGFSGKPAGKIWVATSGDLLWYSDSLGQTRFIQGTLRTDTSGYPLTAGRVFIGPGLCTEPNCSTRDIYWVSNSNLYSAHGNP